MTFPIVLPNDDGIRPAGKPDECFYCQQKVGQEHSIDCVTITKKVRVRYSFDVEIEIPHSWDKGDLEFSRNEGSWCAGNAIRELQEMFPNDGPCPCSVFKCEYLETTDETPRGKTYDPPQENNGTVN